MLEKFCVSGKIGGQPLLGLAGNLIYRGSNFRVTCIGASFG